MLQVLKDSRYKKKFDEITATLVIAGVSPEDSGEYECAFAKGSQELSSISNIHVLGETMFLTP